MHEVMVYILARWNQHNISLYGIWGGWQKWRNYEWQFLGRNILRERRDNERGNYGKYNQDMLTRINWPWYLDGKYMNPLVKLGKKEEPWKLNILEMCKYVCTMLILQQGDIMLKGHHKR